MPIFYENTEQISNLSNYEFNLPKYPESTTDPSYYEPTASRIANMYRAARQFQGLYDYTDKGNDSYKEELRNASINPTRKPGMTLEEVSQFESSVVSQIDSDVKKSKEQIKKEKEDSEKSSKNLKDLSVAVADAISINSDNNTKSE